MLTNNLHVSHKISDLNFDIYNEMILWNDIKLSYNIILSKEKYLLYNAILDVVLAIRLN